MLEYLTKEDVPDSLKDIVDVIGMDSLKELSRKFGISEVQVRNIIRHTR